MNDQWSDPRWLRGRITQLEAELQAMAVELHEALNEPMYAGNRADWIFRAQKSETELNRLETILVTGYVCCGDCYLHGERPGKHEGPCIEEEVQRLKKEKN